jgi:hypothetical protein
MYRRRAGAARVAIATALAIAVTESREAARPSPPPALVRERAARRSFPSGHSSASTAYLVATALTARREHRTPALALALAGIAAVDTTRSSRTSTGSRDVLAATSSARSPWRSPRRSSATSAGCAADGHRARDPVRRGRRDRLHLRGPRRCRAAEDARRRVRRGATVALATLALAYAKHGGEYASIEARSMLVGALAFGFYAAACV